MFQCCFSVSSVIIGVEAPWPLRIPDRFEPFVIPWQQPDVCYRFAPSAGQEDLTLVAEGDGLPVYTDGAQLYRAVDGGVGGGVKFLVCRESPRRYCIYYPRETCVPAEGLHFADMLSWAENFLDFSGFYLHSSCVSLAGKAVVFSAPSGTGKSTQAALWERYLGAETLNGDRTILRREAEGWRCYGSPYAGSSDIYKNESVALGAVVVLAQGAENNLTRLTPGEAFVALYRETVQNPWNRDYMEKMSALLERAVLETPVFRLICRPDREAVELVHRAVFGEGGAENHG